MTPDELVEEVTKLALSSIEDPEVATALGVAFNVLRQQRNSIDNLKMRVEYLEGVVDRD